MTKVTPYNNAKTKKKQVTQMLDKITGNYNFLNNTIHF